MVRLLHLLLLLEKEITERDFRLGAFKINEKYLVSTLFFAISRSKTYTLFAIKLDIGGRELLIATTVALS